MRSNAGAAFPRLETEVANLIEGAADPRRMRASDSLHAGAMRDDLLCSQADDEAFRHRVLLYHPRALSPAPAIADGSEKAPPIVVDVPLPEPFEGPDSIFVCYRRSDLFRVVPILHRLIARPWPIWYDRGILGGEEWDAVIERKIGEARLMLILLSQAAIDSRYCRREIKLADAIEKPLLIVALESATLRHGLSLLLQSIQQIPTNDAQFDIRVDRSICNLLSRSKESH